MLRRQDHGDITYFRGARTYLGRALYQVGLFFVDGLLVDSGPPNLVREVEAVCRELGVRQCVTTHHHEDHSGNHRMLMERFGVTPRAHASGLAEIADVDHDQQLYRRVSWGIRRPARVDALGERVETERFRFDVLHTPGHAYDHVVLFEPARRWLFSGDLFLATRLKYLRAEEDVYAMLDSLRRCVALEPEVLFCQHRGRVADATNALRRKLEFLEDLGNRIRDLHGRGLDEAEIARRLPGSDTLWRVWTGGDFSKRNFVRAFLRPEAIA